MKNIHCYTYIEHPASQEEIEKVMKALKVSSV